MTEKGLYTLVIGVLNAGLAAQGAPWSTVTVFQAYQPSVTGTPSGPFLALSNQPARRYGYPERTSVWDAVHSVMDHTESQRWTSIFQINSQWKQDPSAGDFSDIPTPGDLAQLASAIMQSDATVTALLASGVGMDRITDVRQPPFKDDFDAYEYGPLFDFCLTYLQVLTSTGNPATPRAGIYPV